MPIPVVIDRLAEELDALMDETSLYLNRETGEFITVLDHDLGIIEDKLEEEEELEWPWEGEDLQKLRDIVETEKWVCFPSKSEVNEWRIMQRFAFEMPEPLSSSLEHAIHGSGAFRAFKSVLHGTGRIEAWYQFKHESLVRLVAEVLEIENIPFKRGRVYEPGEE
jgi:hypothetical protein